MSVCTLSGPGGREDPGNHNNVSVRSSSRSLLQIPRILFLGALACSPAKINGEENWPQFRGPSGRGHSSAKDVPLKWSPDSVLWKISLKGKGQSSAVNWGDNLFLTGSSDDGRKRYLYCVDGKNGKMLWEKTIDCASPERPHRMNSYATPTCATDGERVVAFFGPGGLHCHDLEGRKLWSRQLGDFPGPWGVAASPVIVNNMVIQNCDAEGASSLVALDLSSGEVLWQTARTDKPRGGWSTPVLIETGERKELVLNGELGVRGYDPVNGKELWFCRGFNGRGSPVPDFSNGLLYVVNGKPGDTYAVKPGGSGDVTKSRMAWHAPRRGGRDLPSPVVVGDFLVVVSMSGLATCYDAASGKVHWQQHLGEKGEYAAAPLVVNGHVLIQSVYGGKTVVLKPGKRFEVLRVNDLGAEVDEVFRSCLSPIKGKIFARSLSMLYCVGL